MKKKLILDIDEVVLSWTNPFFEYWKIEHTEAKYSNSYCLGEMLSLPRDLINQMIEDFNSSDLFGNLPTMPGFNQNYKKVADLFEIHVVSSCLSGKSKEEDSLIRSLRVKNLELHGLEYESISLLSWKESKADAFSKIGKSIVIEDNVKNGHIAKQLGNDVIILQNEFNHKQDSLLGLDTWCEITKKLEEYA